MLLYVYIEANGVVITFCSHSSTVSIPTRSERISDPPFSFVDYGKVDVDFLFSPLHAMQFLFAEVEITVTMFAL
jgi:hypothetical protein